MIEKGENLSISFYEVSITLIPKLIRARKGNYLLFTLKNVDVRFLTVILADLNELCYNRCLIFQINRFHGPQSDSVIIFLLLLSF